MDLHIDDFCHDVARILLDLHAVFPRKHAIYVEDISGPDEADEVGLHSKRYESCLGAMVWLAEEHYIRFDSLIYRQGIDQAVLTHKAFVLLAGISDLQYTQIPDEPLSVREQRITRVEQLRQALQSNNSHKIGQMVRYLLSLSPAPLLPETLPQTTASSTSAADELS